MSFGGKGYQPAEKPKTAGVDADNFASNQEARPLRWFAGVDYCPLTWISGIHNPVYKELRQKAGKGKSVTTGYNVFGDIAGLACVGLVDAIEAIECDSEEVWTGNVTRPTSPGHPNYWRAEIVTSVGRFYVYWGREDQPVDDVVLGPLGTAKPELAHPAYRGQCYVVCKRYFFGQNRESVPNTRIRLRRAPRPALGAFAPQNVAGGESLVAAVLEILTDRRFGAAMPAEYFTAAQWEALSVAVLASLGGHSPSLDRQREVRDFVREALVYFDGWARIEGGKIVPGRFPHDGTVPAGLTEISQHDMTERPRLEAPGYAATANEVEVVYRDRTRKLKDAGILETAEANAKARRRHQVKSLSMPWIVDQAQAASFAAEAAQSAAEGERGFAFSVRRARARWAGGAPLQAGDNLQVDYQPLALDEVARISRRVDNYDGTVSLEAVHERGVYPLPYSAPGDERPALGIATPLPISHFRVLELPTPLAGTPLGLYIAFLAKRPASSYPAPFDDVEGAAVLGLTLWFGGEDGATYDPLGVQTCWAVRGVLRIGFSASFAPIVQVQMDADNLDLDRIVPMSGEDQANDTLLLVVGEEIFSVGAIVIDGPDWDFSCLRARQGSVPAAATAGDVVWLVYRDELERFTHRRFSAGAERWFKPQPYTSSTPLDLADVDAFSYEFRDRDPEKPVIVIAPPPASPVAGSGYTIQVDFSDLNGDLASYEIRAVRALGGGLEDGFTLRSGSFAPAERAGATLRAPVVFPSAGTWRIVARALDERDAFTEVSSANFTVAAGLGDFGPDDGLTPGTVSGLSIQPGLNVLWLTWTNPTSTPLRVVYVYEAAVGVRPALPSFAIPAGVEFLARDGLAHGQTRYFWFEAESTKGRRGAITGPFAGTTRAGIESLDLVPGSVTAPAVGTNLLIAYAANIADAIITGAKIAAATIQEANIANAAITNAKIANLSVSTLKIQDQAVIIPVAAFTAGTFTVPNDTIGAVIQTLSIVSTGAPIAVGFSFVLAHYLNNRSYDVYLIRNYDPTPGLSGPVLWAMNGVARGGGVGTEIQLMFAAEVLDTPGAGTHTYSVYVRCNTADHLYCRNRSVRAFEVKK